MCLNRRNIQLIVLIEENDRRNIDARRRCFGHLVWKYEKVDEKMLSLRAEFRCRSKEM